jgi:hypothetical protein
MWPGRGSMLCHSWPPLVDNWQPAVAPWQRAGGSFYKLPPLALNAAHPGCTRTAPNPANVPSCVPFTFHPLPP